VIIEEGNWATKNKAKLREKSLRISFWSRGNDFPWIKMDGKALGRSSVFLYSILIAGGKYSEITTEPQY
jgi:hypothetical protein